ncbi:putative amino-acid permease C15C4.04c [Grifola frondosa]|uniref:Putative amino-acid permease C15C4.04c n=1 Tax=Grifola frondosa TaxID=5627 RepID=A0A1C7M4U5_GRIFR|nr:putative amino-acid permease C15C4.04c [Grifola frondosa]
MAAQVVHVGMGFEWLIPPICRVHCRIHGKVGVLDAASILDITFFRIICLLILPNRTSAGLYYFSARLAPETYSALAIWITGWANIIGQVTLACSIDCTVAQMITTAIAVSTNGSVILSSGPTYGILIAILFVHGFVCSAGTRILAPLNLFYGLLTETVVAIITLLVGSGDHTLSTKDTFTLFEKNTGWANDGWPFLLSFMAPCWHLLLEVIGLMRSCNPISYFSRTS